MIKMKSGYEDPTVSAYWESLSGDDGHPYKSYVVDPVMFKMLGSLKQKIVVDLGCGNGYLGPQFIRKGAKQVYLMDISKPNLEFARNRNNNKKVTFIHQDATRKWKIKDRSVDIVFSDMMLNEIENIKKPFKLDYQAVVLK